MTGEYAAIRAGTLDASTVFSFGRTVQWIRVTRTYTFLFFASSRVGDSLLSNKSSLPTLPKIYHPYILFISYSRTHIGMKKFIILYNGPATPADKMTPDMVQKVMNNWKTWMGKVGSSMLDMGQPMAPGKAVVDDGTMGTATLLSGYSIIQAEDMDAAVEMVKDHPFLSDKTGKFSVEVYELMPAPM